MSRPALLTIDPDAPRLFCECCGLPTLEVPLDGLLQPEYDMARRACRLCDWENPPLTPEGALAGDDSTAEERNDGHSLTESRANFARHLSMYDPSVPEPWMLGPPSGALLERKEAIREAYVALLGAPESEQWALWRDVLALERALATQLAADRKASQESGEDVG